MRRPLRLALLFLVPLITFASLYYYWAPHSVLNPWSTAPLSASASSQPSMTEPHFSLSASLRDKKRALLERLAQPVNDEAPFFIIMGNEAGDTDSLASSALLAHLLSTSRNSIHSRHFPASSTFVPLMQLPRKDLRLRSENDLLLSVLQLDPTDILFLDDLPELKKMLRSDIQLGLTDHPQLSAYWQPYDQFVQKVQIVVDHHADDGAHKDAKLRVLRGPEKGAIGSAVSVVVDLFKETEEMQQIERPLADLGLAAVLIDTDDLRPTPRGKATPTDIESATLLLDHSSLNTTSSGHFIDTAVQAGGQVAAEAVKESPEEEDEMAIEASKVDSPKSLVAASAYYRILAAKKLDVSRLDSLDLLRRDYKENVVALSEGDSLSLRAGFSSVPVGLCDWVHERYGDGQERWSGYWGSLYQWMGEKGLDIAVVGTSFREDGEEKGKHKRELIFAFKQQQLKQASRPNMFPSLVKYLESDAYSAELGNNASLLLSLDHPWKGWRRIADSGKKERVGGLEKDGRWTGNGEMQVAVWLQRNGRASRKTYLPAVVHAVKKAAKGK